MYALELARQEQIMGEQQQVEQGEEGESFDSEDMDYEQLLAHFNLDSNSTVSCNNYTYMHE